MTDISVEGLTKYYGAELILNNISFEITRGERVGLLGDNGSGKTTLFKIIAGELDYDSGSLAISRSARLGLIEQIPNYPAQYTVERVLQSAFSHIDEVRRAMDELSDKLDTPESMRRFAELSAKFEAYGGYETDVSLNRVCNGLGISRSMREQYFSELSGGEKTRISLARAILQNTDILLLDEPTNHLDVTAVEWLEDYLKSFKGSVLTISHDRYFLDKCVTRVIELTNGRLEFYPGNYSYFVAEKQARYDAQLKQYLAEQKKAAELEFTAKRLHGWGMGNKRLQVRAFSMERRAERIKKTEKPEQTRTSIKGGFKSSEFAGDKALIIKELAKSFGEKRLFSDVSLEMEGGDRIGIIGLNGAGKTTLLNLIMGTVEPDAGYIRFAPNIKTGLLAQKIEFPSEERSLVDTMLYSLNMTPQTARNHLAAFDFTGEEVFKSVSVLSGGERSRLALCMLMSSAVNLLALDEPTNHLDIASREWIESEIEEYNENLLFVSHDRYFINRFATRIWAIEDGKIIDFSGTYEEYREYKKSLEKEPVKQKLPSEKKPIKTKKELRKKGVLERDIERLQQELGELESAIGQNASDFEELGRLYKRKSEAESELDLLIEQWLLA